MGCLVALVLFILIFWSILLISGITVVVGEPVAENIGLLVFVIIVEIALIVFWIWCMNKYHSPENAEKMKQAREKAEKQRAEAKKRWEEEQARRKEAERLRTTVVATKLIGEGAAEYKKSVGSMAVRGAVGGFIAGSAGAALGMASAKNKNTNKNVRRFLVKYLDGHIEEKEATIGSAKYKEYMEHLVWEEQ